MPLPLAMMIPFMGIQSAVMAKQFGENFQYGKRRISAMSNEEFNKLTPTMLMDKAGEELKAMIPSMEKSVIDMREFQTFLVREFLQMVNDAIGAGLGKLFGFEDPFQTGGPPPIEPTPIGSGGKPPPGGENPHTTPPVVKKQMKNFSDTPIAYQRVVLILMKRLADWAKKWAGSSSRKKITAINKAKIAAIQWKAQYIAIGGYKNPTPYDSIPYVNPTIRAFTRGWEDDL